MVVPRHDEQHDRCGEQATARADRDSPRQLFHRAPLMLV
jgi:hypothetical protein